MIRPMKPEEFKTVIDLNMSYAPERAKELNMTTEEYLAGRGLLEEQLKEDVIFISEQLGRIVGMVSFKICSSEDGLFAHVRNFCVAKDRANGLVGPRLMRAMEKHIKSEGCTSMTTAPRKEQSLWRRMLKKYGFSEYAESDRHIYFKKALI